jgi:hypothetical protein
VVGTVVAKSVQQFVDQIELLQAVGENAISFGKFSAYPAQFRVLCRLRGDLAFCAVLAEKLVAIIPTHGRPHFEESGVEYAAPSAAITWINNSSGTNGTMARRSLRNLTTGEESHRSNERPL